MDLLKQFTSLPKVNHTLTNYRDWINRKFENYINIHENESHDFVKIRNAERDLWVPIMITRTGYRYCLESLSVLNELEFQIVLNRIKDYLESFNSDEVNFEILHGVICREMESLKKEYKRSKEIEELFKNN